jgi:multicomponent K+:H+ antiporter subunit G
MVSQIAVAILILIGALFSLAGSIGLARLPDFYMRLHGPAKTTTLGIDGVLLASVVWFSRDGSLAVHQILIAGFLFVAAPVAVHLLSCAAIRSDVISKAPVPAALRASVERTMTHR